MAVNAARRNSKRSECGFPKLRIKVNAVELSACDRDPGTPQRSARPGLGRQNRSHYRLSCPKAVSPPLAALHSPISACSDIPARCPSTDRTPRSRKAPALRAHKTESAPPPSFFFFLFSFSFQTHLEGIYYFLCA